MISERLISGWIQTQMQSEPNGALGSAFCLLHSNVILANSISLEKAPTLTPVLVAILVLSSLLTGMVIASVWNQFLRQQIRAKVAEIKESEERYRLLFNKIPLPCWVFDDSNFKFLA